MAENKVYPDWVQKQRVPGTTVKRVGNNYYLYKHSSKRVKGKKNPVPVDTYIGRITPDGIEKGGKKKIAPGVVEVWEFGFSRALEDLCPQGWKEPLGANWRDTLDYIILRQSPESYLKSLRDPPKALDPHIQINSQSAALNRRLKAEYGVEIKELRCLSTIYLVSVGGKKLVSKMSPEQQELVERLQINVEVS